MQLSRAQSEALFEGFDWRRTCATGAAHCGRVNIRLSLHCFVWLFRDLAIRRMSSTLDLSLFPNLPPEVVKAFGAVRFELSVERAARQR